MYKTRKAWLPIGKTKGFTLVELIVVMIIVSVLATLGITQYGKLVEKGRGTEAKQVLGSIRSLAAAYRIQYGGLNAVVGVRPAFNNAAAGIGINPGDIPFNCSQTTNFFSYAVTSTTVNGMVLTATRCEIGGKSPSAPPVTPDWDLVLTTDFFAGTDLWTGAGGY